MQKAEAVAQEIERLRQQLGKLIGQGAGVDSQEVADLSRKIDAMVAQYMRLQREQAKVIE
ncbi:aspartyl-phosphate phosphatase Spo0E family protein [Moorellaceae bacterium AZ2]